VNIEHRDVFGAFRRSAQLVRRHLWLVLGLVMIPTAVESLVEHGVHRLVLEQPSFWMILLVNGLVGATIGAWVGLIEVVLAFEPVQRDHVEAVSPPGGAPAGGGGARR
jgi:hypothetical protein